MTDSTQILLTAVVATLTVLLVVIGVQIFLILGEVRNMLQKVNGMLGDASRVTRAVVEPIEEASSFVLGLKKGLGAVKAFKKIFAADKD